MRSPKFLHHSKKTYLGPLSNYTENTSPSISNYIIFLWPFLSAASAISWPHFISGNYLFPALSSFSRFQWAQCHLLLPKPQRRSGPFAQLPQPPRRAPGSTSTCTPHPYRVPRAGAPWETLSATRSPSPVGWQKVMRWDLQSPLSVFMKSLTQAQNFNNHCLTNIVCWKQQQCPTLSEAINLHISGFYGKACN